MARGGLPNRINVVIILPFGDLNKAEGRGDQLKRLLAAFNILVAKYESNSKYHFFIIVSEQTAPAKYFNRGLLINLAYKYFIENVGTPSLLIFHDIDMIPDARMFAQYLEPHKSYSLLPHNSATFKKEYGFKAMAGAAVYMTTPETFVRANGFPNNFWGWGGEDNALHARYERLGIKLRYNYTGDYVSTDAQRTSHKNKTTYLKERGLRNMCVWELVGADKSNWAANGVLQLGPELYAADGKVQPLKKNTTHIWLRAELRAGEIDIQCAK